MDPGGFAVQVEDQGIGACALALSGRLDARGETPLSDAHALTLNRGARVLVAEASGLDSLDGAGLALLVKLWAWATRGDQVLRLVGFGERCRALLGELGLEKALPVYASVEDALAGRARPGPVPPGGAQADFCGDEHWAAALGQAHAGALPEGFLDVNVGGRKVRGPLQGFGQLWHKTYRARLPGAETSPREVARVFREHLGELWPKGNRLHLPDPGVVPGAVGTLYLTMPGGVPLATGVRVLHADDLSFTLATLAGHLQAGWITFGAHDDAGCTVAQVQSLGRTGDPLYEVGFRLFGHSQQEHFWNATLEALGRRLGRQVRVESLTDKLDAHVNWSAAGNVWDNAGLRTGLHLVGALFRRTFRSGKA